MSCKTNDFLFNQSKMLIIYFGFKLEKELSYFNNFFIIKILHLNLNILLI